MNRTLTFSLALAAFWVWPIAGFSLDVVSDPLAEERLLSELQNWSQQLSKMDEQASSLKLALSGLQGGQYQWSNAEQLINQLGNLVQETHGLAYNAQNVDGQFKTLFPGYQAPQNYAAQYQSVMNTTNNTLNGILQSLGSNANDFQDENKRLAFLQAQAQNAGGQTQAIQASAQIASEEVSQLQLLRQTLVAQTNAQTVYYAAQVQKEASAQAEFNQVLSNGTTQLGPLNQNPLKASSYPQS